jgi:hypothetical protein
MEIEVTMAMAYGDRNRNSDQAKVAAMILNALRRDDDWSAWGLDGKRPFGNSGRSALVGDILEEIGAEPEGTDEFGPAWSEDQQAYALELWGGCAPSFEKAARWLVHEAAMTRHVDGWEIR